MIFTRQEVEKWAGLAKLSSKNPRDHLSLATVLIERNEQVEAVSYRTIARWESSPPMSATGWFLKLPFGFFSLEDADSEEGLFEERKSFLSAVYSEIVKEPPALWEWESHEVPEATWKRWVDPHQVARLREMAPKSGSIPLPPRPS